MPIKKDELHKMSDAEIVEETARLRSKLFELKQQSVTEQLENNRQPGNIRKDIARLQTEARTRELAATKESA